MFRGSERQGPGLTEGDVDIQEINELEVAIVESEDDANEKLWQQAGEVVKRLESGMSQRALARAWVNLRTGEAYNHTHVHFVAKVFSLLNSAEPRPRFRDAYNEVANAKTAHVSKNTGEYEWYTPEKYIEAVRGVRACLPPHRVVFADAVV